MLPLSQDSLTARSIEAKMARKQQRYASTYSTSYIYLPPTPPVPPPDARRQEPLPAPPAPVPHPSGEALTARHEVPTSRSLFEVLRDAEADPELRDGGIGKPLPETQRGFPDARFVPGPAEQRRLRKALLGGTAGLVLCGIAGGAYYTWANKGVTGGATGASVADSRARPASAVAQLLPDSGARPAGQLVAERTPPAASGQDGAAEILSLRPALQSTVPLSFLPAAADLRHRTADATATSADAAGLPPAPAAPAGAAEPAVPAAPPGTAPAPQPKPTGTVAPAAAPAVPAITAEAMPAPPRAAAPDVPAVVAGPASKPSEVAALPLPTLVPVVTITAKPAGGRGGAPTAMPSRPVEATAPAPTPATVLAAATPPASAVPVVTAEASPAAGPATQPDVPDGAAALPPGFTAQQMTSMLALVNQMALLVHDMHDENIKYRAQMTTLTGTVQAKASDFEQRLRLAEARSSVAAAIETGKAPAPAPEPDPSSSGSAGEARPPVRATAAPRSVRDYRIRRASYDYAELVDPGALPDEAVPLEVVVGDRVPGVGRVTAITVRGGAWVVRTDHGVIQ